MSVTVRRATIEDLEPLAILFSSYRLFYEQSEDVPTARELLCERIENDESVIFLAEIEGEAVGFTQLYPSFSSTRARRTWILNDLFVAVEARRKGVGRQLMEAAHQMAKETGALRVELATTHDNHHAQALYESVGYRREETFYHYQLEVE